MGKRRTLAIALFVAIFVAAAASPVPASNNPAPPGLPTATSASQPSPSPSLAPLYPIYQGPDPISSASPLPGQPKLLGHVYANAYCQTFVEHFNNATNGVISDDRHLDNVDSTIHAIDDAWNQRDGAMRVYDDRVKLIADVGAMLKAIPQTQTEVNALLAQAKATTDPDRKAALQASASQLQHTLDRQKTVTYDLTNVIHVLLDKHTAEDTAESNIQNLLLPGYTEHGISLNDDPVDEPGTNTMMAPSASPTPQAGDLEDVLQWSRQRWIIATAESQAAVAADHLVRICDGEVMPSPSPSP